jgi:hypothetical protein
MILAAKWKSCRAVKNKKFYPTLKILPNLEDIHILVAEMDDRIDDIRDKCAPETGIDDIRTEKEEFDKTMAVARVKVEDAIQYLGAGNFGG